ncbi:aminobenzoate synthetase [Sphingomonas sp. Leaf17]|uniref:aminodeoxychorismate synthase component I n=1 Tax=Sphingomonas sp. Leaf17 TaxID=1735683 RepID=UPI0006F738C8|nr:aminodeoxychorismate synthase component I [Sphingomonas sp. Leaf17]KQM64407.1 aminobenzoate synthetase [Sphingomonas sp. Leaf17]
MADFSPLPPPPAAAAAAPFVLLDSADGTPARLYRTPGRVIEAWTTDAVAPALDAIRAATRAGLHAAGFLSYDAGAAFEPVLGAARSDDVPLLWFGLFTDWTAIDDVPAWLPDPAGAWIGAPEPAIDRATYGDRLAAVQALIAAGDLYQANLTYAARVPFSGDPLAVYARVRTGAAAGYGAVVATGTHTLLSFSPELFFARDGATLTCRPMKGTARRGETAAGDAAAIAALRGDAKQRAENLMIVDLMRNDLSRVARAGSVAVPQLFAVETYPTVHQMVSTVTATLADERDTVDVIAALFPCGSITGAPKIRAMQAIGDIEARARAVYTGSIGRIDAGGDAAFNVAIRTLTIRDGEADAAFGVGSGIVADSDADAEWDECAAKGDFLTAGARAFDLIETMAFDPLLGLPLLERHLERMRGSATALGFAFDRHGVRNELQAATFRLRAPARVRVLASAGGAIAIEVGPMPPAFDGPATVAVVPLPVAPSDVRLRHKTSDRAFYDAARAAAGTDEVVFVDPDGRLTEGSFTSVFVARDGVLVTPPLAALLPGVLRGAMLEDGRAVEGVLTPDDLTREFYIGNALRGLIPAVLAVAAPTTLRV